MLAFCFLFTASSALSSQEPHPRMMPLPTPPGEVRPVSEPNVKLVKITGLNAKRLVKGLTAIYGDRPGFRVAVIAKDIIVVQGDEKAVEQVIQIVDSLRPVK